MSAATRASENVKPACTPSAVSRRASWKRGGVARGGTCHLGARLHPGVLEGPLGRLLHSIRSQIRASADNPSGEVEPEHGKEGTPMAYTRDNANKIADALRSLPAAEAARKELSKQGMVNYLAAEILGLQERGYTIVQIAESLRVVGLEITTATLKTYLRRMKRSTRKRGPKRRRRSESRATETLCPTPAARLAN